MIPGQSYFPGSEDAKFSRIALAAAWPAVRPGFVVVLGEHRIDRVLGKPVLVVLDEAGDDRLWHVVEKLAALREYYHPEQILVDGRHVAAMQFIDEFRGKGLQVQHSLLCAIEGPCAYAFPVLYRALETRRLVIPAASALTGELQVVPRHEDLRKLVLSDYPAVAALSFAVLGLESTRQEEGVRRIWETTK